MGQNYRVSPAFSGLVSSTSKTTEKNQRLLQYTYLSSLSAARKLGASYKATGDYQRSVFEPCFAYVSFLIFLLENMLTMWNLGNW